MNKNSGGMKRKKSTRKGTKTTKEAKQEKKKAASSSSAAKKGKLQVIKVLDYDDNAPLNDKVPDSNHPGMELRVEEVNALPDPIIDREHLRSANLHVSLREGRPQKAFRGSLPAAQTSPRTACRQILTCQNDNTTLYLGMENIQRDHYANLHLDADEVRFIRNLELIWGTYGAIPQQDMIE